MRGKSITRYGIILISAFATLSVYAQQQEAPQRPQDFATAFQKAHAACMALWADHTFDSLRDKFPLGGTTPTFAMLTDQTRILPKDRPLAELAIKTMKKCRALAADALVMLPQQTQQRFEGFYREHDSLNARLYLGKISIGEYNVGINRIVTEEIKTFYGDARAESSDVNPKKALPEVPRKNLSLVQQQVQTATVQAGGPSHLTRLALVIGNSKYTDLPKLKNPSNDAHAIVDALRDVGFDVTLVTDASETNIRRAVRKFADQSDQVDVALVYYAGHGAQVNGENYLLPVDMEIPHTEADIELSSLKVDDLLNSIRSPTKIVFLDACRDNPALFKNLVKGRGAIATGLAPTDASHLTRLKPGGGVFIAYATDAGSVALEGEGEHSPFTQALLRNLKKPISIDDMFSFVTREVSLVTKGMQRPYKYASLENIICLTGTCSGTTPTPAANIVQEAQRSASDELQIALQTNNRDALETYLGKYPESPDRQKVLAEIGRLKRSEFNEWTLFQVTNGANRFPLYLEFSSIRLLGDRVAIRVRSQVDPTLLLIGTTKYPDGSFYEDIDVIDCRQSIFAISERTVLMQSGELLGHYKWADPEVLNLSIGSKIAPGMIAAAAKNIVCDEQMRTPLVTKKQLASMSFLDVASTANGDGEIYYQPVKNERAPQTEKDAIVLIKQTNDVPLANAFGPAFSNLNFGSFNTGVHWDQFKCDERKVFARKSEFYDRSNNLQGVIVYDPPAEFPITEGSPFDILQHILCRKQEVQQ